jgi:cell filamentation protein, protein adenylyltransferase
MFTVAQAMGALDMTAPTVASAVARLERLDIVRETTGRKRDRVYSYAPYLAILSEGAEPIPGQA